MTRLSTRIGTSLAAVSILLAAPACAQQTLPTPQPETRVSVAEVELNGPALWKVADEDTTIYLFGTVHALPKDIVWFKGPIADALGGADEFVTEVDMSDPAAMQPMMMAKASLPEGQSLRDLLKPDDRTDYETALAGLGMPPAAFDKFEPWFASMMFTILPLMKAGYSPDSGVEQVLLAKVGDTKKKGELETAEYQIDLFDSLPMDTQVTYLNEMVDNVPKVKETLDRMVAEWSQGDPDGLGAILNDEMDDPVLYARLLTDRNANWAKWIDQRLDTPGTVFIAVGAGHLAGKGDVQEQLEKLGIATTRVQ